MFGHLHRRALGAERQPDALEEAQQVEFGFCAHVIEHFVAREIVHLDDHIGAQLAEARGKRRKTSSATISRSASNGALTARQANGDARSVMAAV